MPQAYNGDSVFNGKNMVDSNISCHNKKCVTKFETELDERFYKDAKGNVYCAYCDSEIHSEETPEFERLIISGK
ncbi:MAG: hypothetical protein R3Y32_07260 [Bacillota bacterium]